MYILFNELGNIVTAIPHGQEVRQGNDFDLYVCFPSDSKKYLNLTPIALFQPTPNGSFITVATEVSHDIYTFQQEDVNEAVFEFKPGTKYIRYHLFISKETGVTANFGKLPFIVKSSDESESDWQYEGRGIINVIRTIGNSDPTTITPSEYESLLAEIRAYGTPYVSYFSVLEEAAVGDMVSVESDDSKNDKLKIELSRGNTGIITGSLMIKGAEFNEYASGLEDDKVPVAKAQINTFSRQVILGVDVEGNDYEFYMKPDPEAGDNDSVLFINAHGIPEKNVTIQLRGAVFANSPYQVSVLNEAGYPNIYWQNGDTLTVEKAQYVAYAASVTGGPIGTVINAGAIADGATIVIESNINDISGDNTQLASGNTIKSISGSIIDNNGDIETNSGDIGSNYGSIENNSGSINNVSTINSNSGAIREAVEVNFDAAGICNADSVQAINATAESGGSQVFNISGITTGGTINAQSSTFASIEAASLEITNTSPVENQIVITSLNSDSIFNNGAISVETAKTVNQTPSVNNAEVVINAENLNVESGGSIVYADRFIGTVHLTYPNTSITFDDLKNALLPLDNPRGYVVYYKCRITFASGTPGVFYDYDYIMNESHSIKLVKYAAYFDHTGPLDTNKLYVDGSASEATGNAFDFDAGGDIPSSTNRTIDYDVSGIYIY